MWPLLSTEEFNGYTGITIVPRWATNIYYNCNLPDCTVLEWINTGAGSGDFNKLLADEVGHFTHNEFTKGLLKYFL